MLKQVDEQKISQLVKQAWADKQLRKSLEDDPIAYLRQNGIAIQEGAEAHLMIEKDSISLEVRMPQGEGNDSELSDKALDSVVGGGAMHLIYQYKQVPLKTIS